MNQQSDRDKMLDDFVVWNGTREIFHAVQDYKRKLRQAEEGMKFNIKYAMYGVLFATIFAMGYLVGKYP